MKRNSISMANGALSHVHLFNSHDHIIGGNVLHNKTPSEREFAQDQMTNYDPEKGNTDQMNQPFEGLILKKKSTKFGFGPLTVQQRKANRYEEWK